MPPKRSAQPPPLPPPVASSEETASGSGSEEEEIAHSTPPAAPKSIAPPPQKVQESEASDEDEDDDEEEDDEEGEDEKASHVIPSSATENPPPPPPTREESESSDEEEEAADDEMPQAKPAPNQEMDKGARRRGAPFQRTWSTDDDFRILEVLAAHRVEHGTLPQTDVLANALAGRLDKSGCSHSELQRKVKNLQSRYTKAVKKGAPPSNGHDSRLFDLFKNVWPSVATTKAVTKVAANGGAGREPDEMSEMYPFLAEEVRVLQKAHPGLFKREFAMIDDSKAHVLEEKIKKQRHVQMKLYLRHHDLSKEVTKTLMGLSGVGGQS